MIQRYLAKLAHCIPFKELGSLRHSLTSLDFTYSDPYPGFNRNLVKGLVASLLELDPSHFDKTTALEIAAGGRLYNVVVEDEKVASQLLNNGRLKKRVTIIPLNKIQTNPIPAAVRDRAQFPQTFY